MTSTYTAHADPFVRENLPAAEDRPDFLFTLPDLQYPERLNATTAFVDSHVAAGHGDRPCLISPFENWSYRDLQSRVDRIARVLVERLGLIPGGRVLLRAPNTPMLAAAHLAVWKAGGVVVATMPLLRAKELSILIGKARIALALCDGRLLAELEKAREAAPLLERIVAFGHGPAESEGELERMMAEFSGEPFPACDTAADDPCLVGFTSGTTGEPKGTIHNHRDLLATCDSYGKHVLHATASDTFIGSPPLAFTFGLGGLLLFPLRVGASTVLLERATPDELLPAIARHRATICFTAPTAYRVMLGKLAEHDISCLRIGVSAGETLPKAIWDAWHAATSIELMDGIGSTEMLHIFIGSPQGEIRPGATGRVVPGYEAKVVDEEGNEVPPGTIGRLAVRGPTGCRYLADERQKAYVRDGWNFTGDSYSMDEDGYFWYQARSDDMIVSSGYNIAGPEVEAALLSHPAVAECGVVGAPDPERGQIVKAYVVLRPDQEGEPGLVRALQDHVKAEIAPYKYPRAVAFVESLPRTGSGKLQRFRLREMAQAAGEEFVSDPQALLPPGWPLPKGYANGMAASGRIVVTGGLIGWDEREVFAEGFLAQARQALLNLRAVLAAGGAEPRHLVRLNWYVVDMDEYLEARKALGPVYREILGRNFPAMAVMQIVRLVEPAARLEIEGTAIVTETAEAPRSAA